MEMIGQDYDRIDRKWALLPGLAKCFSEGIDMVDKSRRPTVGERHREKVGSTLNPIAPISDHSASYPEFPDADGGGPVVPGYRFAHPGYRSANNSPAVIPIPGGSSRTVPSLTMRVATTSTGAAFTKSSTNF
jgi:hypothetical protein